MINSIAIIVLAAAVVVNTSMIRRLQQDAQEPPRQEPRIEYTVTDIGRAWQMHKYLEAHRNLGGGA